MYTVHTCVCLTCPSPGTNNVCFFAGSRGLHGPQDAIAIDLPGPEESIGDQDVISTQDHAEVARAMPLDVQFLTC